MSADHLSALRPALHRYCARMTGSIIEGEDIVQDTFERALATLGTPAAPTTPEELRRWLFRVAHNQMIDRARSYGQRMSEPLEEHVADDTPADEALAGAEATHTAIACFLELPPLPRSCVILKDVLDHSLEEIATLTDLSLPAVKAALHRGRAKLAGLGPAPEPAAGTPSAVIARYVDLFNRRDWDGVRALLAEDVRLDVRTKVKKHGRREVGVYFTNYSKLPDFRLAQAWLEGREVVVATRDGHPPHLVELEPRGEEIAAIRDAFHLPYLTTEARFA